MSRGNESLIAEVDCCVQVELRVQNSTFAVDVDLCIHNLTSVEEVDLRYAN